MVFYKRNAALMKNANNSLSLDEVWRQYQHSLKAFLHSKVANEADVEDLQQEILLKTYQSLVASSASCAYR